MPPKKLLSKSKKAAELHNALLEAQDNLLKKEKEVSELRQAVEDANRHLEELENDDQQDARLEQNGMLEAKRCMIH
jgi:phosphoenolpyruvate-protein kinase (PTS system EI component)